MLFSSWTFFLFFPLVAVALFFTPHRWQWLLLLTASCVVYMFFVPVHILVAASMIVSTYAAALVIERTEGRVRRYSLATGILAVCAILFYFKYYDFFAVNVSALARVLGWNYSVDVLRAVMPVGLSFYAFQSIGYLVEVHRGRQQAERHFGMYSLYILFFPKVIAGPIERPQNLLPQLREKKEFDFRRLRDGLQLFAWGLFKKAVIADRLARFVNPIFDQPQSFEGLVLAVAALFFTYQLYCDFSGYTDMALGAAEILGFRLQPNFDRPYASRTVTEFWRRWHISLSTWLRDYLFAPIAMKYRALGTNAVLSSIIVTFFICGLWHGASWNFVIWGLLNGLMICLELVTERPRKRLGKAVPGYLFNGASVLSTFAFVNIAFIFFRAATSADAVHIITHMLSGITSAGYFLPGGFLRFYPPVPGPWQSVRTEFLFCIALLALLTSVHALQKRWRLRDAVARQPWWIRWTIYYAGALSLVFFSAWPEKGAFIYTHF